MVFITVDPARDTPAALKTYLSSRVFPKNIIGLTGTPAQIAQVAKAYAVYYQKEGTGADLHDGPLHRALSDGPAGPVPRRDRRRPDAPAGRARQISAGDERGLGAAKAR